MPPSEPAPEAAPGPLSERILQAILDTFSYEELQQALLFRRDQRLDEIAPRLANYRVQVFELLDHTAGQGDMAGLLCDLAAERPALQNLAAEAAARQAHGEDIWAWMKPVLSRAHRDYLKSWFDQPWATVPLADILGQGSGDWQPVHLLDIYVPLQVDFGLTLQVQGGKIVDWWAKIEETEQADEKVGLIERAESVAGGEAGEAHKLLRPRTWPRLGAGEAELQRIVDENRHKIEQRRNEVKEKETEDKQAKEKDGPVPFYMEAHDAAGVQARFVLLGEPGSGKSSFLRHLALCLAGELRRRSGDKDAPAAASHEALREWLLSTPLTPIYVETRDLVKQDFPALPSGREMLDTDLPNAETFWRYMGRFHSQRLTEQGGELRQLCDEGRAILLLDGLDEVQQADDEGRRRQVQALVKSLVDLYPKLRIIIAARTQPYQRGGWALAGFGAAELRPLALDRLRELAHALFRRLRGATDGAAQADAFIRAVRQQLDDGRIERSFYANPLFFTLLAGLWLDPHAGGGLPETRAALYRRSVELLLWRWTRRRLPGLSVAEQLKLTDGELRSVLETLACTVHEQSAPGQDTTEFGRKELLDVLDEAHLSPMIGDITDYLGQHTGLLTCPAPRKLYFTHRSFQEHLAACELICPEPDRHRPAVAPDRRFPHGLVRRVLARPELWEHVTRLAADELAARGRNQEMGKLLVALCAPYLEGKTGTAAQAALLALDIARQQRLFDETPEAPPISAGDFDTLRKTASKAVEDWQGIPTPEQRNRAGEVLGLRRDLDTRPGAGLRRDGLPDILWQEVPETDAEGQSEFVYQEGKRPKEATFWMARHPITYAQFQTFIEAEDGYHDARWWEGLAAPENERRKPQEQRFPFWNHPRDNVTWYAAVAFCRWLTFQAEEQRSLLPLPLRRRSDWRIRLPTEWQWEKAARGHDGRRYPWGGDEYRSGFANIDETYKSGDRKPVGPHYLQKSSAAGMYPHGASPYGICDLSGNVWEWCLNEYENPDDFLETGSAGRVLRGGSWYNSNDDAAASVRYWYNPDFWNNIRGFRVVACVVPVP